MSLHTLITQFPIKDILVNAVGSFIGGIALLWLAMSKHGIRYIKSKLERPSVRIEPRKTPENIFKGIDLGAPARWVEQQLGVPTRIGNKWWGYRFSDSLVSLTFDSNDSIKIIAVALIDNETTFEFPSWHFNCPCLGELTLENLIEEEHLTLEFRQSTRHSELMVSGREGPRGAWHYIAFGALSPHFPGPLLPVEFDWDDENKVLRGKPQDVKINWAAVSNTSDIDGFPWDLGLTH
ncbi:hypothetical protein [Rahnella aceris]|jgi:hypothetical protein|uniref:hypothetical protein n=1 Tax=Rahnella sp. (strain Y9602) TaxID=2703885 RepID=UPI000EAF420C|nr:hypothetical protein [Rahnella aceris]MBU9863937.1 hypothetical protein [Rahnella aceris]RKT81816.1 hypothetical protein BJ925_2092 [Rahnella aquatilis]